MTWTTLDRALEQSPNKKVVKKGRVYPYKISKVSFGFFADDLLGKQYVVTPERANEYIWKPYDDSERELENWWDR